MQPHAYCDWPIPQTPNPFTGAGLAETSQALPEDAKSEVVFRVLVQVFSQLNGASQKKDGFY
ncbi:MAG: hypothetical protein WB586_16190 [Chthoniobacterales bacterium]